MEALTRLRAEHANLLAALVHGEDPQAALALVAALRFNWCAGDSSPKGDGSSTERRPRRPSDPARARG
ncbi:hypothetical protein O1M63_37260 [Streptomyces mirabilis]|nr:hypothetical protein [Streptomyces mirabilis]